MAEVPLTPTTFDDANRSLMDLMLDETYALALSGKRSMSHASRAQLFGLPEREVTVFLKHATELASTPTSMRATARRRSRFLRHQKRRGSTPMTTRKPELSGIGPALPLTSAQLREARDVYRRLIDAALPEFTVVINQLECLLRIGSRTNSSFHLNSEIDAKLLVDLLKTAGIGSKRIGIRVLALPKSVKSKKQLAKVISAIFGVKQASINFGKRTVYAKTTGTIGRLELIVRERSASGHARIKAAAGWRSACYYGLAVLRTLSTT